MEYSWARHVFTFMLVMFHHHVYAGPVSQSDRLAYQASMDQEVEKHKDTSINITIQISVSSESQWPKDRTQIQNVNEDIGHSVENSMGWSKGFLKFVDEKSRSIDNKNILKWRAMIGLDRTKSQPDGGNAMSNKHGKAFPYNLLSTGQDLKNVQIGKYSHSATIPDNDQSECDSLHGKCQDDSLQCTGSYVSGKCSGPTNIKCCTNKITLQDTKSCQNVPIYSRDSWGARRPVAMKNLSLPVGMFFIHHTDTATCYSADTCATILRSIQRFHMETRKWDDIAYSFLVGQDGRVYEGRGWKRVGSHTLHYNDRSLAVSVMGNFTSVVPNSQALKAVQDLLACGAAEGYLTSGYSLYGHRDVRDTECPGDAFYNLIRTWPHYNTTTDKDGGCLAKHGVCKPNYLACSGQYEKGLCNGYSKRQCCVP